MGKLSLWRRCRGRACCTFIRESLTILRKAPSATSSLISPSALPATALSQSVLDDFAVDSQGQFYIPLIWKDSSRAVHSGVFVLDVDGRYQRTVEFTVPAELRRIAVDGSGNLFALGVDARYYKGLTMDTSVLHKYNPFGVLGTAFSPQSIPMGGSGELDLRAKHDIDRGLLFIDGGLLYSILTESRVLRVFDLEGALVRQVSFSPPMSRPDRIWHLALLADGTYLVHWVHSDAAGYTVNNTPYLSVHDGSGKALSPPTRAPWSKSFPVSSDPSGNCYFLHQLEGDAAELVSTTVRLK